MIIISSFQFCAGMVLFLLLHSMMIIVWCLQSAIFILGVASHLETCMGRAGPPMRISNRALLGLWDKHVIIEYTVCDVRYYCQLYLQLSLTGTVLFEVHVTIRGYGRSAKVEGQLKLRDFTLKLNEGGQKFRRHFGLGVVLEVGDVNRAVPV